MIHIEITSLNLVGDIRGRCIDSSGSNVPRIVEVILKEMVLARLKCRVTSELNLVSTTLDSEQGSFAGNLPIAPLLDNPLEPLSIRDVGSDTVLVTDWKFEILMASYRTYKVQHNSRGFIDSISQDGEICGWAWNPDLPADKLRLDFLVDGQCVGSSYAAGFREDLRAAGLGDGCYGYRFYIPWRKIPSRHQFIIQIRDSSTGLILCHSTSEKSWRHADLSDQLFELDRRLDLLKDCHSL